MRGQSATPKRGGGRSAINRGEIQSLPQQIAKQPIYVGTSYVLFLIHDTVND